MDALITSGAANAVGAVHTSLDGTRTEESEPAVTEAATLSAEEQRRRDEERLLAALDHMLDEANGQQSGCAGGESGSTYPGHFMATAGQLQRPQRCSQRTLFSG